MSHRKSKPQFENQERNTQKANALLNYLKRIALQQSMLRIQVFTHKNFKRIECKRNFFNIKKPHNN
jgi:hypothetical protein